jgi:hypothetical protein
MSIVVFYLSKDEHQPRCERFKDDEYTLAMKVVADLRKLGEQHVSISLQLADNIGKPGVDAVTDGKTPDGHDYEWSKQHRGAGPRKV